MSARRVLAALVGSALLAVAPPGVPAQASDEGVAHELLWLEAAAAVLALAAAVPDVGAARPESVAGVQGRLERAVVRLINSRPPLDRLAGHVTLLPFIQELAAAARAVTDARDAAGLAAGRAWLDEALTRLSRASRPPAAAGR